MKKNLSKIYSIAVIIALVILGAWSAWDIYSLRTSNSEAARININNISKSVESSYNSGIAFNDKAFSELVRGLFRDNPDLELLTVYTHDDEIGIEFHYDRSEEVELLNLNETSPLGMKDLPEYKYNQLMKAKLTSQLNARGRTGLEMDLIYKVVDRVSVYNILIRLLIVVVVLFFTTLFMIFTVSRKGIVEETEDDFSHDDESEEDMSLDWDQQGFTAEPALSTAASGMDDLSLDEEELNNFDLNDTTGDFGDLDLDSGSGDMTFDDVTESFETDASADMAFDEPSVDFGDDLSDELSFDDVSDDFNLDEPSDDFGSDLSDELSLEEPEDDFGLDLSDDLNTDEPSDGFGSDLSDELNLEEPEDDFGMDLSDELNLDEPEDDFGSDLTEELNLDEPEDGFGSDLSDELNLDEPEDDFGMDLSDELNLDETADDFGSGISDEFNLDEEADEFSLEENMDMDLDSDIPEEEDLLAMDHEVSPAQGIDDFDFDDIGDTFGEEEPAEDDDKPSLYSPRSGVGWEDFIEERVNLELERAAAEDQDLVMGLIQCENLTEDNYRFFADQLKEDFNYPDLIFEYKDKGFALIVPHEDLDSALHTLETFTGKEMEQYGKIHVGISSRNGRLIQGSRIFMEAENALHKAVEDPEKNIVGFRSDPDKFREFLSEK